MSADDTSAVTRRRGRRRSGWSLVAPWVGLAGALWSATAVASVAWVNWFDELQCEHPEWDSEYGEMRWQIWPPGHACEFDAFEGLPAMRSGPALGESVALGVAPVAAVAAVAGGATWAASTIRRSGASPFRIRRRVR